MRRTRLARFLTAMFGIWFTFTLALPNGMSAMNMSGGSASMNMASTNMSMAMGSMMTPGAGMATMDMSRLDASRSAISTPGHTSAISAEPGKPVQPSAPVQCDQHDCCCAALSVTMLAPDTTLAWLPEHVINQETPQSGDSVVHADEQHRLPFANGPPAPVSA